jgi:uncharacterized protein YbbK (DUF523 family)
MSHTCNCKPKIGISACLLGKPVRYDGGHKLNQFIKTNLENLVDFIGVCPETECGFGIPREQVRLEGNPESPRIVGKETQTDKTERLTTWIQKKIMELETENLNGFIFKSKSPSCGLYNLPVFTCNEKFQSTGTGLFTKAFIKIFPNIPVEEDSTLKTKTQLNKFLKKVFPAIKFNYMEKK